MSFNTEHQSSSQQYNKFFEPLENTTIARSMFTPSLSNIPWNISMMPWLSNQNNSLVEFTGTATNLKPPDISKTTGLLTKRKSDIELNIPAKHLITEEKMVAHMNGLHISKSYVSHRNATADVQNSLPSSSFGNLMDSHITMTQRELEQKLKNAQSITVCEEVKKLSNDPIIPKILLERLEKPCTALVVWQPPKNLHSVFNMFEEYNERKKLYTYQNGNNICRIKMDKDLSSTAGIEENEEENIIESEEIFDNNNPSNVYLNNCMDLDM